MMHRPFTPPTIGRTRLEMAPGVDPGWAAPAPPPVPGRRDRHIEVDTAGGALLAGLVADGRLVDLLAEPMDDPLHVGGVVVARVQKLDPARKQAFVDVGQGEPALLALGKASLRAGSSLLVQATAEPRAGKGAEVTRDVALAGCLLVHTPLSPGLAASKALDPAVKERWRSRLTDGWILRRAAAGAEDAAVLAEAERLRWRWQDIRHRAGLVTPPVVIEPGPDVAVRLLLDAPEAGAVIAADATLHRRLRDALQRVAPELQERLQASPVGLIEAVPPLLLPEVPLACGGRLIIERTRALTAVDVDGGRCGDALRVNREAAQEVARQLRLRNLSGITVVDFVSPRRKADRAAVVGTLRAAVADDPAGVTLAGGMSPFGLVELMRPRRGRPLHEVLPEAP